MKLNLRVQYKNVRGKTLGGGGGGDMPGEGRLDPLELLELGVKTQETSKDYNSLGVIKFLWCDTETVGVNYFSFKYIMNKSVLQHTFLFVIF